MKAPKIKKYEVETCVADWTEISIEHKLITYKFIKKYLSHELMKLPFVTTITVQGKEEPVRLGILGHNTRLSDDICLFFDRKKNKISIMITYGKFEDDVVQCIVESLEEYLEYKKDKK